MPLPFDNSKYDKSLTDEDILKMFESLFKNGYPPTEIYYTNKKPYEYPSSTIIRRNYFKHLKFARFNPDTSWDQLMTLLFNKIPNYEQMAIPTVPLDLTQRPPIQSSLIDLEGSNYWGLKLIPKQTTIHQAKNSFGQPIKVTRTYYMIR